MTILCFNSLTTFSFQLTSSRRGWHHLWIFPWTYLTFQLTSSRRGWPSILFVFTNPNNFNSHPHEEDDHLFRLHLLSHNHFNSHPHEEDDGRKNNELTCWKEFQLTSSRRGWQSRDWKTETNGIFQLTSSRRGWRIWMRWLHTLCYFNSHPHEEDDSNFKQK